jgi:hypothetical protein
MREHDPGGGQSPANAAKPAYQPYRTEWHSVDTRRRVRTQHEIAGASRDLTATLIAGGGV